MSAASVGRAARALLNSAMLIPLTACSPETDPKRIEGAFQPTHEGIGGAA